MSHSGAVRHIVLLGQMGSGKTTVGGIVAQRLGRPFIDGDAKLVARTGRTGREIAVADGIPALHAIEHSIAAAALGLTTPAVIAPAASVVDFPDAVSALGGHVCVWLWANTSTLAARRPAGTHRRTVDADEAERLGGRRTTYAALAAAGFNTGAVSAAVTAAAIVALVDEQA